MTVNTARLLPHLLLLCHEVVQAVYQAAHGFAEVSRTAQVESLQVCCCGSCCGVDVCNQGLSQAAVVDLEGHLHKHITPAHTSLTKVLACRSVFGGGEGGQGVFGAGVVVVVGWGVGPNTCFIQGAVFKA